MVVLFGALAMVNCEPRQARKGATVVISPCAEMLLRGTTFKFIGLEI